MGAMDHGVQMLDRLILRALGPSGALAERQALTGQVHFVLRGIGHSRLADSVASARRAPTRRGGEAWELVITAATHSAMAKLRLVVPVLLAELQKDLPGLASVSVAAQRATQEGPRPIAGARPVPPPDALARLRRFYASDYSQDH